VIVSIPVPRLSPSRLRALCAVLALAALAPAANALEHITLSNGFSYDCSRHESLGDLVRLYCGATPGSYQEIPATEITSVETLPDPPKLVASASASSPAPAFTAADVRTLLARAGAAVDIDVELLAAVVKAESGYRIHAVSRTGAQGLMQLMPATAHQIGVQDAFRPDQNVLGGVAYLTWLINRYDANDTNLGLQKAIAAYNAGPAAVDKYHGVPPYRETRAYVARVLREFQRRKLAEQKSSLASR
jgi:hypothetical protein